MTSEITLQKAVENFALLTVNCTEADLERPWAWGSYDEEGIRFAFFRTYESLRQSAVDLTAARQAAGKPISRAQHTLAQYQHAFRDLESVLLGLDEAQFGRAPAEEQWSPRQILRHIIDADQGFYFVVRRTLDGARSEGKTVYDLSDEGWMAFWADDPFESIAENGTSQQMLAYYREHHERVLGEFAGIRQDELALPSEYWEAAPMSLAFRLGRFDSHLRQHTIQVEKALDALQLGPNEARRLLRLIYNALAEVEGCQIGAAEIDIKSSQTLAGEIDDRTTEIKALLAI